MNKKYLSFTLALIMCLALVPVSALADGLTATPTASTVLVNGAAVAFDAYNINGNNYFKLRDLAYTLNGTAKQFSVGWDGATNSITLTSGEGYTAVGGEMSAKGGGAKTAVPTTSKIIKDGAAAAFTAYNIDGNNYFKLRDIGAAFDFGVDWDGARNTIVIDTGKGYTPEGGGTSEPPNGGLDAEQELVGIWVLSTSGFTTNIEFKSDGTYYSIAFRYSNGTYYATHMRGDYSAKSGIYTLTNLEVRSGARTEKPTNMELFWTWTDEWHSSSTPSQEYFYAVGTDENGKYLVRNQDALLTGNESKWR